MKSHISSLAVRGLKIHYTVAKSMINLDAVLRTCSFLVLKLQDCE